MAMNKQGANLPIATLMVNLVGCFLIGLLFGWSQRNEWFSSDSWLILATGFCGGFTTFSAFALENVNLFTKGQSLVSITYTAASVIGGVLLCRVGVWLSLH
jgi:CrcB protein